MAIIDSQDEIHLQQSAEGRALIAIGKKLDEIDSILSKVKKKFPLILGF